MNTVMHTIMNASSQNEYVANLPKNVLNKWHIFQQNSLPALVAKFPHRKTMTPMHRNMQEQLHVHASMMTYQHGKVNTKNTSLSMAQMCILLLPLRKLQVVHWLSEKWPKCKAVHPANTQSWCGGATFCILSEKNITLVHPQLPKLSIKACS